ncbi:hypothetical protein P8935_13155 [Telmatobacter sp. DSM 110680]|uniref:Uncharacterized protein n=1 Tax=Telmatobacter sp. DSM 110680 TaxID=3036704 RepID=A0AAU7DBU4_9BACT
MPRHSFSTLLLLSSLLLAAAMPARADKDAVQFGSRIVVPEGKSIHDAVCFFCSVDAKGDIDHDVVVFFGNVHVAHQSKHDIVVFFGSVRADDNAAIGHDLVNFFGSVHLGEDVTVGNDVVVMFGGLHAADSASISGNRVAQPPWIFWTPLLVIGLVIIIVVREIRGHQRRQYLAAYGYPPIQPPPPPPVQ